MTGTNNSSEVVFLLGAGASVKAGVPDTFAFVKEFQQSITDAPEKQTVDQIVKVLEQWKREEIDVELLLETLTKLDTKDAEPLLKFIEGGTFILSGYPNKRPIVEDLKDFIKSKAIIDTPDKVQYLDPLLGFMEAQRPKPLDIISVNYDTCVEQFCNVYKLNHEDGFDVNWNPEVFERQRVDIRLYKLHGSVIWYRSDRGSYIKLPVMTEKAGVRLIWGESAESLMLYPMQKLDYAEPLLELLIRVKKLIENENCRFLIVVGYSFRDDHIRRIILDVARKNTGLTVVIIDPKASQIYQGKLKYFPDSRVVSPLDGRVVCLPYKFEEVFPSLETHYLHYLRFGLGQLEANVRSERMGQPVNWLPCLRHFAEAEHFEKVEWLLQSKKQDVEICKLWQDNLLVLLRMSLNLAAGGREEDANRYLQKLRAFLYEMMFENTMINIALGDKIILVRVTFRPKGVNIAVHELKEVIKKEWQYVFSRSSMTTDEAFLNRFGVVKNILEYLEQTAPDLVTFEQFALMRESHGKELDALREQIEQFLSAGSGSDQGKRLRDQIEDGLLTVERQVIGSLFV